VFIQRFSSNASKARQATSRKKLLEKIAPDDLPVSSRKYPWIAFRPERPCGSVILEIENLSKTIDGEKVRCMLARMMLTGSNVLLLDEPTNHLDLEAITALNEGLMAFPEVILFASHDYQFVATVANRIVELTPEGAIDRSMNFDEYLVSTAVAKEREAHYCGESALAL